MSGLHPRPAAATENSSGVRPPEEFLAQAFLIRAVEKRLLDLFAQGKLYGTVHTCIGQELSAAAVCAALSSADVVVSNHRCHGHFLARTGNVEALLAETMGKATGASGGRGGSQHLHAPGFFSNGILGSTVPVAAGLRAQAAVKADWGGSLVPVVVFEAARFYDEVNVGITVDAGQGLFVPVVGQADKKSVDAIAADIQDLMLHYVEGSLDVKKLPPGTFTITDLSGEGMFGVQPLVNWRQCATLGLGAEFSLPGWASAIYQLSLTFDHRLTEGRAAAAFLRDLQARLQSYEARS